MTLTNKIIALGLSVAVVFGALADASAAPSKKHKKAEDTSDAGAILFRIENIEPLRNRDGLIDRCSFMVTVYNRMEKEIKEAVLNLNWVDNISGRYDIQKGEIVVNEDEVSSDVVASKKVTIASIMPHRQKSFTSEVVTDKCFLLLDNVEYSVESCINEGEKLEMKDSKLVGSGSCTGNFNYISSKNPEYYSEFKDVPESVLEQQAEEEKNNEVAKINEKYNSIMNEYKAIGSELENIK